MAPVEHSASSNSQITFGQDFAKLSFLQSAGLVPGVAKLHIPAVMLSPMNSMRFDFRGALGAAMLPASIVRPARVTQFGDGI
jgi:hypothetical protein|tara:strand:- start:10 stop:255 length:246 start_codon:yes stop_codon:yes gene_type:complete